MADRRPLPTLLSQVLVAFTIEFDNEAEHQMSHWTTTAGGAAGPGGAPWLVSQVMWSNVMQYVSAEGVRVRELHARARTARDSLTGLQRWRYVDVKPHTADSRTSPPRDDLVVHATAGGRRAQAVWRPLASMIEERWRDRFGSGDIRELRESLQAVVAQLDVELPQYLPVMYPAMGGKAEVPDFGEPISAATDAAVTPGPDLSALVSQVLLRFTLDFERESKISLPISANTLRVLNESGVRIRDLPRLTGVSKEANRMSTGFLTRHGCATVEPDPNASRGQVVRLTARGLKAQAKYRRLLGLTEERWQENFGDTGLGTLRGWLERLVGEPGDQHSPLLEGLAPYSGGWRAAVRKPETLPHYPMVLHRGGYPDGS
jgi:DNA-binding MarR family transcriptional regulator